MIFITAVEILANRIRNEKQIRGFEIKLNGSNHSIKISQLADDTTLSLKLKNEISIALNIIEIFGNLSGLKLNRSKTEGIWLGRLKHCVTNLHYVFIYYILDNLIWLYFPLTPIEKSNRPIVYHVVRLPMRFKQGELKVSRHMYVEWSTRFVFK